MSEKRFLFRLRFIVKGEENKNVIRDSLVTQLKQAKTLEKIESGGYRIVEQPSLEPTVEEAQI